VNTQHPCARCGGPVHDNAPCCTGCTREAVQGLAHLVNLDAHLETTRTRQDHHGAPGPRSSTDEIPLPVNLRARAVSENAHRTLGRWARIANYYSTAAAPLNGPACSGSTLTNCPHSTCRALEHQRRPKAPALADLATDVAEHLDYLRVRDDSASLFNDIARVREAIERVCDSPPTMIELGPCDQCDTHLRAARDTVLVDCRICGASYDVAARKAWLISRIDLLKATPPVIAAVLTAWMEVALPVATIHTWINRKHLHARGTDPATGHPTYRIGDVRARHLASIRRKLKAANTDVATEVPVA
jgi:hypothetical protein